LLVAVGVTSGHAKRVLPVRRKAEKPGARAIPPRPEPDELTSREGQLFLAREKWFLDKRRNPDGSLPVDLFEKGRKNWANWASLHPLIDEFRARARDGAGAPASDDRGSAISSRLHSWKELGPKNIAGRVLSVAFDPSHPDSIWAGSAGGGLYRSSDFGAHWRQIGGDDLPSLWIGAVAIDPRNPNVLYAGTGETNSNVGGYGGFGGVLKSGNGGKTFTKIAIPEYGFFKIVISSADSSRVLFAAGNTYLSTDAGKTVKPVLAGTTTDLAQDPKDPMRFIAVRSSAWGDGNSGLRESRDGGATWQPIGTGLPDPADWGRSAIAFAAAPSKKLFFACATKLGNANPPTLYVSDDDGRTWALTATSGTNGYGGVGWYGAHLAVSPTDANFVIQNNGGDIEYSADGGMSWTRSGGNWHPDSHGVAFSSADPSRLICATDGGVAVSRDGGATFTKVDAGFPTVQFYTCETGRGDDDTIFGGTQDNWGNVYRGATGGEFEYTFPPGLGDVGAFSVNAKNPQEVEAVTAVMADIGYSLDGGRNWFATRAHGISANDGANWAPQMTRSLLHPEVLYLGSRYANVSVDGGYNWGPRIVRPDLKQQVASLAVNPTDDAEVWSLWDDADVYVSEDAGATWAERPLDPSYTAYRGGNRITAGPKKGTAYICLNGTTGSRVFSTRDGGATWKDITSGLPQISVNSILADKSSPGRVFVSTDAGVAISRDDGASWQDFSAGLPNAVVLDLCMDPVRGRLAAATYGRGMWELGGLPVDAVPPVPPARVKGRSH